MLQGAAVPGLLASFEAERRPVALANTALSVANWHAAMRVPQARAPCCARCLSPRPGTYLCMRVNQVQATNMYSQQLI